MPRVHTQKAAKDYPEQGIKKGSIYYWWKFRFGGKIRSATRPRASQLTQSEYLSALYGFQEDATEMIEGAGSVDEMSSALEGVADEVRALGEEQSEKVNNMPESLQQSPTAELLTERADACEAAADEITSIDCERNDDETTEEWTERIVDEFSAVDFG